MDLTATTTRWIHIPISRIEDLSDAVLGAGLEATQMSSAALSGSLVFAQRRGMICSSGCIGGTVALRGPLSQDKVTLGLGLDLAPGAWHWMHEVKTGAAGLFLAGDEHDARYRPGSLYATVSIDADQLEEEAAQEGLVLDRRTLGGTGIHSHGVPSAVVTSLRGQFKRIHAGQMPDEPFDAEACDQLLLAVINHFGRQPFCLHRRGTRSAHARVVRWARSYISEHLTQPISLDDIAKAAFASRRTLYRAFAEILDDTPQSFVRRVRLHRIRHDLASDAERSCTIALVANQWGISELGRMARWCRELFGERPSDTLARKARHPHPETAPELRLAINA